MTHATINTVPHDMRQVDVAGLPAMQGDWIAVAATYCAQRKGFARSKAFLVCVRRMTESGNPYIVPFCWLRSVKALGNGTFAVETADGCNGTVDAGGKDVAEGAR